MAALSHSMYFSMTTRIPLLDNPSRNAELGPLSPFSDDSMRCSSQSQVSAGKKEE
jgi:hypothetical protein